MIRIATANDIPTTVRIAFHGLRSRFRRIIRVEMDTTLANPKRSANPCLNCGGDSGRIASAGGSETTVRSEESAPKQAAMPLIAMAQTINLGPAVKLSSGNRKKF